MTIDLSADAADVRAMLDKAVQKYAKKHAARASAAELPPVDADRPHFLLGRRRAGSPVRHASTGHPSGVGAGVEESGGWFG